MIRYHYNLKQQRWIDTLRSEKLQIASKELFMNAKTARQKSLASNDNLTNEMLQVCFKYVEEACKKGQFKCEVCIDNSLYNQTVAALRKLDYGVSAVQETSFYRMTIVW